MSLADRYLHDANELLDRGGDESNNGVLGLAAVTLARAQVLATLGLAEAIREQTALAHGVRP
jgi:hypothetical protein